METGFIKLLLLLTALPAFSQTDTLSISRQPPGHTGEDFELFGSNDLLEMTIHFDLGLYTKKKMKGIYGDGTMTIYTGEGDSIFKNVRIRSRGVFRRSYCSFPPMELNLKKPLNAYDETGTIKKLKLATQCQTSNLYEDYVLKEYLAYRMFNLFTDTSFRVRLLKVNYLDSQNERKPMHQFGFLIEPVNILAERLNSDILKEIEITQRNVMPYIMVRLAIFNYMIGNYDWAVPNQHNVAILKSRDPLSGQMVIAIPHDFDWSGLVNPIYAVPTEDVGIESVRERLYTGICLNRESFRAELLKFLPLKRKIYDLINGFTYLNQRAKLEMINYLEEFYSQLESPNKLERLIDKLEATCKHL
ncbi:MAG: hypothetical protein ABR974_08000 [Bacteroidales bacterium]